MPGKKLNVETSGEAAELFETLFDLMPQMGWTAQPDGYIDYYNQGWYSYTGLSPKDLEGWGWQQVHDPKMLPEIQAKWKHCIETASIFEMQFPLKGADGKFQWFQTRITPVFDKGKLIRWVGINQNIDNERRANELLETTIRDRSQEIVEISEVLASFVESGDFREASKQILKTALKQTQSTFGFVGVTVPGGPQGMTLRIFADEGFNWSKTVNRAMYDKITADYQSKGYIEFPMLDNLFGWPILHGKPIISNDPNKDERRSGRTPAGHPPIENFLGVPILKGETVVGTFGIANRAGGYSEEQAAALQTVARTMSVIYESYRRMRQEHTLIEERQTAEENLRLANQALIDLSYTVSHELQEPLAVLRSQLNLLSARYSDRLGPDADGYIKDSIKSSEIVERTIDDLWEYARIDLPHITFELVSMAETFDAAVEQLHYEIGHKNARVTRTPMPAVYGDKRQLILLLKQLITNGLHFNDSVEPTVEFTTNALVDEVEFCISDNGIGFDLTQSHEIFKMFRKLTKDTPGTGMGLSICKKIIDFHGGRIWAEPTKKGSNFIFTLPLVSAREVRG